MSRIGQKAITVPSSMSVQIQDKVNVVIKGIHGSSTIIIPNELSITQEADKLVLKRMNESKKTKSLHGLYRQLVFNLITGVEKLWKKRLEVVGTGYNVKMQGEDLVFRLGYSHQIVFKKQPGVNYKVEGNNKAIVSGIDKQLVGQIAYQIRTLKPPDVYKGKGVRYESELVRIKPGKKVKTTPGAAA